MVHHLPVDIAQSTGAVLTAGRPVVRKPACLGPAESGVCVAVPGPVDRAWRTKAKVKARLIGDADPDEWDLPPKPKWMRLSTYARWEAKYDEAEDILEEQCAFAVARLMNRKL